MLDDPSRSHEVAADYAAKKAAAVLALSHLLAKQAVTEYLKEQGLCPPATGTIDGNHDEH